MKNISKLIIIIIAFNLFGCLLQKHLLVDNKNAQYVGEITKGNKEKGKGVFNNKNGDSYSGAFIGNKFNGQGTLTYNKDSSKKKYVGNWKNSKMEGSGILTFRNDSEYNGIFKNSQYNGYGTMTYGNGNKYIGKWSNGKRDGKGKYIWADGEKYEGIWRKGIPEDKYKKKVINRKKKNISQKYKSEIKRVTDNDIIASFNSIEFKKNFLSVGVYIQNVGSSKPICVYYGDWTFNIYDTDKSYNMQKASSYASDRGGFNNTDGAYSSIYKMNYQLTKWFINRSLIFILYKDMEKFKLIHIYPKSIAVLTRFRTYLPLDQPVYDLESTGLHSRYSWNIVFDISQVPNYVKNYDIVIAGNVHKMDVNNKK